MPKELDEPTDLVDAESSTATQSDATEATEAEVPAESSPATDETQAESLSVVRDVVEARTETEEAASSAEGEEAGEGADGTASTEEDNEEYSDVPFHKHPRFQQVLQEAKANKRDAGQYRNVEAFLDQVNVDPKEAADVIEIAGLAKTDPVTAWERVKPWVQELLVAAGEVLPKDLAERVASGELTQPAALELSKMRASVASRDAKAKFEQERGQRQQTSQQTRTLVDTAAGWISNRQIKDPNFAAKEAPLRKEIAYLQRIEGIPNTADGVKAQLKKAYDAVNKAFVAPRTAPAVAPAARPAARPAIRPIRGGQVAGNASQAAPKNTLEVIRQMRTQGA